MSRLRARGVNMKLNKDKYLDLYFDHLCDPHTKNGKINPVLIGRFQDECENIKRFIEFIEKIEEGKK